MTSDYREVKKNRVGLGYALNGLKFALIHEINMRVHLFMMLIVIAVAIILSISAVEWVLLSLTIGFVFVAELFNTAIEQLLDYLAPERHRLAGIIKDLSAAAVLLASIVAIINGIIIFLPKIIAIFI
ncbi:diacylglycerol kinase family protein [Amphibacillus sediminis]|uniref:diacylglycerol kinase family protein n=1 Tax=Amphibacillus sediminis TaxID=360185 RepID=UPI0008345C54|nr:diacylglycerol kinase family protein [Amphibacillus sediminis]